VALIPSTGRALHFVFFGTGGGLRLAFFGKVGGGGGQRSIVRGSWSRSRCRRAGSVRGPRPYSSVRAVEVEWALGRSDSELKQAPRFVGERPPQGHASSPTSMSGGGRELKRWVGGNREHEAAGAIMLESERFHELRLHLHRASELVERHVHGHRRPKSLAEPAR